jgi:hypothetical protein
MFGMIALLIGLPVLPRIGSTLRNNDRTDRQLISESDALHQQMCRVHVEFLSVIAGVDQREAWRDDGARGVAGRRRARHGALALDALRHLIVEGGSVDLRRACAS